MHHTKEKGDLGNLKIMADAAMHGFKILTPISEHLPFDFVIYDLKTCDLFRVQAKYKSLYRGVLSINLRSCYSDSIKTVSNRYAARAFDILAIYCPDVDKVVYILENNLDCLSSSVNFSLNKNSRGRFIDDYTNLREIVYCKQ